MYNLVDFFENYKNELSESLNNLDSSTLNEITNIIKKVIHEEKQIFIIGNGGSMANASHWQCDFSKKVNNLSYKRIKVFALGNNIPILSAVANDISYEEVFTEQFQNILCPGDLVICLSVSGNSPNLLSAFKYANMINAYTVSIIGDYGGEIKSLSKVCLNINSKNYGIVEDIHLVINHIISQYIFNDF